MRSFVCRIERTRKEHELRAAVFDCGEELDANAPEGLMDVGVNDITYWCPGVGENVTILQPSFPQSDKKDLSAPLATEPRAPSR